MDFKFALRSIRRAPGFAALAIFILALGIGANTAIFSVVYGVVLKPLNYSHPEELVEISTIWRGRSNLGTVSGPNFLDYQNGTDTFQAMSVYNDDVESVVANGRAEAVGMAIVSQDFLKTLAIQPVMGRDFTAADFDGHPRSALVNQAFWNRHFGEGSFASGQMITVSGFRLEVVGLVPVSFRFPEQSKTEVWIPVPDVLKDESRTAFNYRVVGRLKTGAELAQAQAQLSTVSARLAQSYPKQNGDCRGVVTPLADFTVRNIKRTLFVLLGGVALVLLIACANIANLLLARGTGRLRELAIRAAIGASRARIVRQLLTETLVLALAGCTVGSLVAYLLLPVLVSLAPSFIPRLSDIQLDWVVLSISAAVGVGTTVLFGLAPAWQAGKANPNLDLRASGARGMVGGLTVRLRYSFVTVEIALCMTLLVAAGLFMRSFAALTSVDLGFNTNNLLVAKISYSGSGQDAAVKLINPALSQLLNTSGVTSGAITRSLPGEGRSNVHYIVTGQPRQAFTSSAPNAGINIVSPSFFETFGIRVLDGRAFSGLDTSASRLTAVVNESLVKRSFGGANAIGKQIFCGYTKSTMDGITIVGVVADAHMDGAQVSIGPELFLSYSQFPQSDANLVIKTSADPANFSQIARNLILKLDREATVDMTTMDHQLATTVSSPRFISFLISAFALLAILLAAVGIYGVVAYSVSRRTSEIGLRMALGAKQSTVLGMVLLEALKVTATGLIIGLAGAALASRVIRSQLFGVSVSDPWVYSGVVCMFISVPLVAAFVPAVAASRVEPVAALRQD